jgi:hypothetical protein
MGRRGYSPELRRKLLDLLEAGLNVADVARDLPISQETIDLSVAQTGPHRPRSAVGAEHRREDRAGRRTQEDPGVGVRDCGDRARDGAGAGRGAPMRPVRGHQGDGH